MSYPPNNPAKNNPKLLPRSRRVHTCPKSKNLNKKFRRTTSITPAKFKTNSKKLIKLARPEKNNSKIFSPAISTSQTRKNHQVPTNKYQ